jgi:hypothetical protein
MSTAMSDERIRELREQAATDRLVLQACRARREAAAVALDAATSVSERTHWP